MAAAVVVASALCGAAAVLVGAAAWYEAALPCLAAGLIFTAQTRWAMRKVASNPMSAVSVMMAGIAVHFGVIVAGGLGLIFVAGFEPVAVFLSLLAAFLACQPLSTMAIRRTIFAAPDRTGDGTATTSNRTHFAETSA